MVRKCLSCKVEISGHFNRKRCAPCVKALLRKPKGSMSKEQIREAKRLAGTMPRALVAAALDVSLSNLKRSCPGINFIYFHKYKRDPSLVKKVCAYYEKHGKAKTKERFKNEDIKVRSIVERYKIFEPRQRVWRDDELMELTRMAGLISFKDQAKYFNRPNANAGSVKSAWVKKFKNSQANINGMAHWRAINFVKPSAPFLQTPFGSGSGNAKRILLWVDMEKHLKPDCPDFLVQAVKVMADFQRKLFGVKHPRAKILKMIKERSDL